MVNPHTTIQVSTITGNEDMKGNAKCKNSRFKPPCGGLSMARWKARVDFLLMLIELFR